MKTLSKAKIKRDSKVENILNERAILEKVSHPFIIQMKYAFQNVSSLCFLIIFLSIKTLDFKTNQPLGRLFVPDS